MKRLVVALAVLATALAVPSVSQALYRSSAKKIAGEHQKWLCNDRQRCLNAQLIRPTCDGPHGSRSNPGSIQYTCNGAYMAVVNGVTNLCTTELSLNPYGVGLHSFDSCAPPSQDFLRHH